MILHIDGIGVNQALHPNSLVPIHGELLLLTVLSRTGRDILQVLDGGRLRTSKALLSESFSTIGRGGS